MLNGKMTPESFETLCGGDANKLQSVFSLSYKVIADAECYRLFKHVPNVDDDNEFFLKQAKEISTHPNFPYLRDTYYEFAQYEKLMPSNIRMLVCKVFDKCVNEPNTAAKLLREKSESNPTPKEVKPTEASFDNMENVGTIPPDSPEWPLEEEKPTRIVQRTPASTGRRVIR
jgi:hypothetical protein